MRCVALATLLLLSACSASHADGPPGRPMGGGPGMMGRVPLSLAGEPLGRMARDEQAYAAILVDWARALDTNQDGFLSPEEVKPDIARFFREADSDKDGAINSRELGDYRLARLAALRGGGAPGHHDGPPPDGADRPPPPGPDAAGPDTAGPRGPMMGGGAGEDKVMAADRNLDFRVTLAELEALALERLTAMDSNRDGRTSLDEIREAGIKAFNERPARGGPGGMGGGRRGDGPGRGGPPGGGRD
ncbi:hypothetical protein [Niveispirillum sp.]|uniref:hypothetical protein n=1 Tax=Niveispirillum sp. TaxID=1917217 RepID=UPI001B70D48B|nr:hypothetical protein [Niveispirillum sp.]MBP7336768.1 hypothetical protein [Niveispirillum sp.]